MLHIYCSLFVQAIAQLFIFTPSSTVNVQQFLYHRRSSPKCSFIKLFKFFFLSAIGLPNGSLFTSMCYSNIPFLTKDSHVLLADVPIKLKSFYINGGFVIFVNIFFLKSEIPFIFLYSLSSCLTSYSHFQSIQCFDSTYLPNDRAGRKLGAWTGNYFCHIIKLVFKPIYKGAHDM